MKIVDLLEAKVPSAELKLAIVNEVKKAIRDIESSKGFEVIFDHGNGPPIRTKVDKIELSGTGGALDPENYKENSLSQGHFSAKIHFTNGDEMMVSCHVTLQAGKVGNARILRDKPVFVYDYATMKSGTNVHHTKDFKSYTIANVIRKQYPYLKGEIMSMRLLKSADRHRVMKDPAKKDTFIKWLLSMYKDKNEQTNVLEFISHARAHGYDYPEFKAIEKSIKARSPGDM